MRKTAFLTLAVFLSVPVTALADQPTAELQALDDALPGKLINDPTRLEYLASAKRTSR